MFAPGRSVSCVLAGKEAAPEGGPTEHREIERVRHRDELALDCALDEAVLDLNPRKGRPPPKVRQSVRPRHNPGRGIRDPNVENLPRADLIIEYLDQALTMAAARIRIAHADKRRVLRRDHVAVTLACHEFPDVALAHATAIVDGGVDEIAAGFGKYVEDPSGFRSRCPPA